MKLKHNAKDHKWGICDIFQNKHRAFVSRKRDQKKGTYSNYKEWKKHEN